MNRTKSEDMIFKDIRILVVDDEEILAWSIETELKANGAEVLACNSLRSALAGFNSLNPDLAICDLRLPDGSGMELLKKWRQEKPDMPVIMITAHGAVESAVDSLRFGAFDYLQKPFDMKSLVAAAKRAAEMSTLRQKVSRLSGHEKPREAVNIIGDSKVTEALREKLRKVAASQSDTVFILGASGTGKELAARAIHEWSDRKRAPFVEINCASIPENLLESELFGFEKGAFTDARERKLGLFEMAQDGTIFLDEIGEMPLKIQAKHLRALEYRRFKRLGGVRDISFTARIVAATNRNVLQEINEGRFRSDLYYRLSAIPIFLPDLCKRSEDIPQLAIHFAESIARTQGKDAPKITSKALHKLMSHSWPGNIRELKNIIQRTMVFHDENQIKPEDIAFDTDIMELGEPTKALSQSQPMAVPAAKSSDVEDGQWTLPDSGLNLEDLEKRLLQEALEKARHNQTKAAALLGISRHTFRYRLEKYDLAQA